MGTILLWIAFFMSLLLLYFIVNWLPALLRRRRCPPVRIDSHCRVQPGRSCGVSSSGAGDESLGGPAGADNGVLVDHWRGILVGVYLLPFLP